MTKPKTKEEWNTWIAERVMGAEEVVPRTFVSGVDFKVEGFEWRLFDPHHDENHWKMVMERVRELRKGEEYIINLCDKLSYEVYDYDGSYTHYNLGPDDIFMIYIAPISSRLDALWQVFGEKEGE